MKTLVLVRWELVQTVRGLGTQLAVTLVSIGSIGLVGAGMLLLESWSPFPAPTAFGVGFRSENASAPQLSSILGEQRGGVAFLVILAWLMLLAMVIGPAFGAVAFVRDRRSGRLDRVLGDASRSDVVALAKLIAGLVPLAIVLAGAGPSASFAWLIGGLQTREAIAGVVVLLASVLLVGAVSLLCSALAATEVSALLSSYGVIGLLFVAPLVAGAGLGLAGLRATAMTVASFDPFVALLLAQRRLAIDLGRVLLPDWPPARVVWTIGKTQLPVWATDSVLYAMLAVVVVWLVSLLIEPLHPIKTWRLRRAQGTTS